MIEIIGVGSPVVYKRNCIPRKIFYVHKITRWTVYAGPNKDSTIGDKAFNRETGRLKGSEDLPSNFVSEVIDGSEHAFEYLAYGARAKALKDIIPTLSLKKQAVAYELLVQAGIIVPTEGKN